MTLVACTIKSDVPALISDILITNNVVTSESTFLPTNAFNISPYLTSNWKPSSLKQKTYIIKENVGVTLAGSVYEMKRFLEEFKLRCSFYDTVGDAQIKSFLDGYDFENEFSKSSFFILCIEPRIGGQKIQHYFAPKVRGIFQRGEYSTLYTRLDQAGKILSIGQKPSQSDLQCETTPYTRWFGEMCAILHDCWLPNESHYIL